MDRIEMLCDKVLDSVKESNKILQELKQQCKAIRNRNNDTYNKCIVLADMALTEINLLEIKNMEIDMKYEQEEK